MRVICESVDRLLKLAQNFSRLQQGVKVIMLKQIPLFDCKKRMAWGDRMSTIMQKNVKSMFPSKSDICVKELSLLQKDRDKLFS